MTRPNPNIGHKFIEVQYNMGALLALLGGNEDERLRFWEILKGITSVATYEMLSDELATVTKHVAEAQAGLRNVLGAVAAETEIAA